ncbi:MULTISPECIES: hypothetical protein [unclassified Streptomyces]|uniref:hypothetical protein n=1 Tax=unclassified Streptomyces TaxID=2593676 RepID=UPI000D1A2FA2|nr:MULTISPECIES: hypothetical protein [unclassified Streptomyces]MYZ34161.1 hypothetical protein [Streptomyces sp. SID4917]
MAAILPFLSNLPIKLAVLGLVYVGLIAVVALAAVFSRTPSRRKDAREVLRLLLTWGRLPPGEGGSRQRGTSSSRRRQQRLPPPNP